MTESQSHDSSSPVPTSEEEYRAALDGIIQGGEIPTVFQPIVNLVTGEIVGYESLSRLTQGSLFKHPGHLFDTASRLGVLSPLEAVARANAFRAMSSWSGEGMLFMNNSPPVISEDGFVEGILEAVHGVGDLDVGRVVLEITERAELGDLKQLNQRAEHLRTHGFQIALDDVGAGISGLNRIMSLRPNWVKLDRELVANIDHDPIQQNLLRSFMRFARMSNMMLIAEGIERYEELATLVRMGVTFGQGFYLGRPAPAEPAIGPSVRQSIVTLRSHATSQQHHDASTVRISSLVMPVPVVARDAPCHDVLAALSSPTQPDCAVVLDGRRYLGVAYHEELNEFCSCAATGAEIGSMKLDPAPVIGPDATLAEAFEHAAGQQGTRGSSLVVLDAGQVTGVVPLVALLRAAADAHRLMPSRVSALTGLPGRGVADQWLDARIGQASAMEIAFLDLRDFDALSATHGASLGEAALLRLVGLVQTFLVNHFNEETCFAHLGEDRFLVAAPGNIREPLRQVVSGFKDAHREFFSAHDLESGDFGGRDAAGVEHRYPLTTVRVVYLPRVQQQIKSVKELYELARSLRLADVETLGQDPIILDRRGAPRMEQRRSA